MVPRSIPDDVPEPADGSLTGSIARARQMFEVYAPARSRRHRWNAQPESLQDRTRTIRQVTAVPGSRDNRHTLCGWIVLQQVRGCRPTHDSIAGNEVPSAMPTPGSTGARVRAIMVALRNGTGTRSDGLATFIPQASGFFGRSRVKASGAERGAQPKFRACAWNARDRIRQDIETDPNIPICTVMIPKGSARTTIIRQSSPGGGGPSFR